MRLLAVLSVVAAVGSCQGEPIRYGDLEVWNRSTVAMTVVAQSVYGQDPHERLDVPACSYAEMAHFAVGHFIVMAADGRTAAILGGGGDDPNNAGFVYLVVTPKEVPQVVDAPPVTLPECTGEPLLQPTDPRAT